jgi:hypothetical protein
MRYNRRPAKGSSGISGLIDPLIGRDAFAMSMGDKFVDKSTRQLGSRPGGLLP